MYSTWGEIDVSPESRNIESRALCLKKSIAAGGERGRKINDGVRKGMPLRRQAAVIDFAISDGKVSIPIAVKKKRIYDPEISIINLHSQSYNFKSI